MGINFLLFYSMQLMFLTNSFCLLLLRISYIEPGGGMSAGTIRAMIDRVGGSDGLPR